MPQRTYEEMLADMCEDRPQAQQNRVRMLMQFMTSEQATAVDGVFRRAVVECLQAVGRAFDACDPEIRSLAIPYLMRGIVSNLDQTEDAIVAMLMERALSEGVPIVIAGENPHDCPCPTCTAARALGSLTPGSGRVN